MRRAKPVGERREICAIDDRLFEHRAGLRKLVCRQGQIAEYLVLEPRWPLTVEPAYECHTLLPRDVARANLLCGIVACPADAELDPRGVVVKVVNAIVN